MTKVLGWAKTQKVLRIVDDQVSSPTWAHMLAEATAQVIAQRREDPLGYLSEKSGLYNLAGSGYCCRYVWAKEILFLMNLKGVQLERASSSEFNMFGQKLQFSVLDCEKSTITNIGNHLAHWVISKKSSLKSFRKEEFSW